MSFLRNPSSFLNLEYLDDLMSFPGEANAAPFLEPGRPSSPLTSSQTSGKGALEGSPAKPSPSKTLKRTETRMLPSVEEVHFKNPESQEEFAVVTELRKDDSLALSLQRVSSLTASWPTANPKATHAFYGQLDFSVSFDEALKKGKKSCDYSPALRKFFVDVNHSFPLVFQLKEPTITSLPPGTILRATPVFVEGEHRDLDVKLCPVHATKENPHHVLICRGNKASVLAVDETFRASRFSVTIPFTGKRQVEHFQFLCYSSCHELKRRKMEVVFTLEVAGRAVGCHSFEVKICSYPVRDRLSEEEKQEVKKPKRGGKEKNKSRPKAADAPAQSSGAGLSKSEEEAGPSSLVPQPATPDVPSLVRAPSASSYPGIENPNQFYNIKVQGYENYKIICKILQGLDALKMLGHELSSSYAAAVAGDLPSLAAPSSSPSSSSPSSSSSSSGSSSQQRLQGILKRSGGEDGEEREKPLKRVRYDDSQSTAETLEVSSQSAHEKELSLLNERERRVGAWLLELNLFGYLDSFLQSGYDDISIIKELNMADLDVMNITLPGHRKKLLLASHSLKKRLSAPGPEAGPSSSPAQVPPEGALEPAAGGSASRLPEGPSAVDGRSFTVEHIEQFEKRTIMKRYHSALQ